MIVRQFIEWARTAPAQERVEATGALARAYLYSDLSPGDRAAAEGAMLMLLDDPWPLVRRALADELAASPSAPGAVVCALAGDRPEIAAPVLALSPLFVDADLIDAVATGSSIVQSAIASRAALPRSVAAAIAEAGSAEACLVLLNNRDADIAPFSLDRIVERYGHLGDIREPLARRDDLSAAARQTLVAKIGDSLAGYAVGQEWLDVDNALRIAREACEKMKVVLAAQTPDCRNSPAHSSSAQERAAHRRPDPARAPVGQQRLVRRRAGRTRRHSDRARVGPHPWRQPQRRSGLVRQSEAATLDLSGVQGGH